VSRLKDIKKGTLQIDELLEIVKIKVFRNILFWDELIYYVNNISGVNWNN